LTWFGINLFTFVGVVIVANGLAAVIQSKPAGTSLLHYKKPLAPLAAANSQKVRVLWFIFDEWDQKITFDNRKPGLKLPTIDSMRARYFAADFAEEVKSRTLLAVPSMTMGKAVTEMKIGASDELFVRTNQQDKMVLWKNTQNIFRDLHARGINSAILTDSNLSFCRQFHNFTAKCLENGQWWSGQA